MLELGCLRKEALWAGDKEETRDTLGTVVTVDDKALVDTSQTDIILIGGISEVVDPLLAKVLAVVDKSEADTILTEGISETVAAPLLAADVPDILPAA